MNSIEILKNVVTNSNNVVIYKAYIDPGTGSMLFTILISLLSAIVYGLKGLLIKLKVRRKGFSKTGEESVPFAIYSEGKNYWTTFQLICDEFEKRKINVKFLTSSEDDPVFDKKYQYIIPEYIDKGNKAYAKLNFIKADIVLATTPGLDVYQWKRSKNVKWYVHIFHSANNAIGYRMFGIDFYDTIICVNRHYIEQIRELEQKRGLKEKELLVFGVPYLDLMKKRLEKVQKQKDNEKTTILLAPSWGPNSLFSVYGKSIIDSLLKYNYKIIIRPHPQSYVSEKEIIFNLMEKYPNSDNIVWDQCSDNFESLCKADILISDFSGIIFDFALVFKKPIIYADVSYDSSIYDACWIDDSTWTFLKNVLPNIGYQLLKNDLSNVNTLIDMSLTDKKKAIAREKAIKDTWENVGLCANLTVDYLIKKYEDLTRGDLK